ncbi:MAG: pbpE 2 [Verrucomicrobiales bacterium]|nr:pbpE 2 [Verrucomicrobiales bacterium]
MNRSLFWSISFRILFTGCLLTAFHSRADDVDDYVNRQMRRLHIPGLSLAVVKDGKVIKAKGYGLANVELNVPATKDTVYEIGSVTKVFTSTAVMILVNDGKINLDDKITNYVSQLPQHWSGITVRHLLSHTSGITNDYAAETKYIGRRAPLSARAMLSSVTNSPLNFEPGEKFFYSNTGYYLLGLLIEKASGKSYADFMKERIFVPLKMDSTCVNDSRAIMTNRANGYFYGRDLRNNEYMDMSWPYSAGALISSVMDMVKWDAALYTDKLLPQNYREQMWKPARLNDGSTVDFLGLGWGIETKPPYGRGLMHFGQIPGFIAGFTRWTDQRLFVVVLANMEGVPSGDIVDGISRRYLPRRNNPIADKAPDVTMKDRSLLQAVMSGTLDQQLLAESFHKDFFPTQANELRNSTKELGVINSSALLEEGADKLEHTTYRRYRATFRKEVLRFYIESNQNGKISDLRIAFD